VRNLWLAERTVDETGAAGWTNSEAVSLAPRQSAAGTTWYSLREQYFVQDDGAIQVSSFRLKLAAATSPDALGNAEELTLGNDLTRAHWKPDLDLSTLASELTGCTLHDAALLYYHDALYLAAECSRYLESPQPVEQEFVALFSTRPNGAPRTWNWRYLGKLGGYAEALELGGQELLQTDLAVGADGNLLAIFSPGTPNLPLADHFGCRVVEVASLEPPRLARDTQGKLRVRASVTATDLLPEGPGACAYDASLVTGVAIVRRMQHPGLVVSLHASGLRP
jgi:hypothetical protein